MTTPDNQPPYDPEWFARVSFPDIPAWSLPDLLRDALHEVTTNRSVVAFYCRKGNGKTDALEPLINEWNDVQAARHANGGFRECPRLLELNTLRTENYRRALLHLYRAATAENAITRVGQHAKGDDEIRVELVVEMHKLRYRAIVIDEAETCSHTMLDLLRDLLTDAEKRDPRRADGPGARIPYGFGLLMIGSPALRERLAGHVEAGQRWASEMEHHPVEAKAVPAIYETWFPGFAPAIESMGRRVWKTYIASVVTHGKSFSLRRITLHARRYLRRIALAYPAVQRREDVPFDKALFESAMRDAFDAGDDSLDGAA